MSTRDGWPQTKVAIIFLDIQGEKMVPPQILLAHSGRDTTFTVPRVHLLECLDKLTTNISFFPLSQCCHTANAEKIMKPLRLVPSARARDISFCFPEPNQSSTSFAAKATSSNPCGMAGSSILFSEQNGTVSESHIPN